MGEKPAPIINFTNGVSTRQPENATAKLPLEHLNGSAAAGGRQGLRVRRGAGQRGTKGWRRRRQRRAEVAMEIPVTQSGGEEEIGIKRYAEGASSGKSCTYFVCSFEV